MGNLLLGEKPYFIKYNKNLLIHDFQNYSYLNMNFQPANRFGTFQDRLFYMVKMTC